MHDLPAAALSTLIGRIERIVARARDACIAFDADGTLWSGDVGEDFFFALVERADFRPPAAHAMRAAAASSGVASSDDPTRLAKNLFEAYEAGVFPEERICETIAWSCAGWRQPEVRTFAEDLARRVLPGRVHGEAREILTWARSREVEVFVVSASPREIVEAAVETLGIDPAHVVAATALYEGGTMAAAVERPIPYGEGKVVNLRRAIGDRVLAAAFGDNAFDVAMLREAEVRVAVRPKPRLRERAHEVPELVEAERVD